MIRTLTIGIAAALIATTALAIVLERATRPPAKPPPKEAGPPTAGRSVAALPAPIEPKVVRTEPYFRPKPVLVAPPAKPAFPEPPRLAPDEPSTRPPLRPTIVPEVLPKAAALPNVCERVGRRKVYTNRGRSWRCRK